MSYKPFIFLLASLALVSVACSITVNIPVDEITTGPTKVEEIYVPEPDASRADLALVFGAGELEIAPGANRALVSGTTTYNVEDFKPKVNVSGSQVRIETGDLDIRGIPNFSADIQNDWDLKLGDIPMNLSINAGAYKGDIELGGLAIESLEVGDGAAEVRLRFSEPNKVQMDTLRYLTGASTVRLSGLANANFSSMIFRSGAGDYSLDFSGELQRDAVVTIESGFSQVVIIVPKGTASRVIFRGGLTNVNITGDWEGSGNTYSLEGDGPVITINVDMGAGNLELRTR